MKSNVIAGFTLIDKDDDDGDGNYDEGGSGEGSGLYRWHECDSSLLSDTRRTLLYSPKGLGAITKDPRSSYANTRLETVPDPLSQRLFAICGLRRDFQLPAFSIRGSKPPDNRKE